MGKSLCLKVGRIMLKSEEKGEESGFYFLEFLDHAAAWFRHAAAYHENTGFEEAQHAATQ